MQENSADPRWSFIDRIPFPWLQRLYSQIPKDKIPTFRGQTLIVGTDTSGTQRGSQYAVMGVLVMDMENSSFWRTDRLLIRSRFLRDGRRMSYKNLNDRQRRAALVPFLDAADRIRGLCVVMAFDRRLGNLCTSKDLYERAKKDGVIRGKWKQPAFEQMMRTVQLVSTLLASVAVRDQNIYWISDMDECFATQERKIDTARMMSAFTSEYVRHNLGELGVGTTELDEGDRLEEDITAIPDLAAGAVCDVLNRMHQHLGSFPLIPTLVPILRSKTDLINSWFFSDSGPLVKLAWAARTVPGRGIQVGHFRTEPEGTISIV
jgi:hypothetical protein